MSLSKGLLLSIRILIYSSLIPLERVTGVERFYTINPASVPNLLKAWATIWMKWDLRNELQMEQRYQRLISCFIPAMFQH